MIGFKFVETQTEIFEKIMPCHWGEKWLPVAGGHGGLRITGAAKGSEGWWKDVSKAAATILRHKAFDFGLSIRSDAYCRLADVLRCSWLVDLGAEEGDLLDVAQSDEKGRFDLWHDSRTWWIRCVQGHSIKSVSEEALLWPVSKSDADRPDVAVHGTFWKVMHRIRLQGLIAGGDGKGRNHVHFAPSALRWRSNQISGVREEADVAIHVDLNAALQKGLKFYWSRNCVLLTRGPVPPECFLRIEDLESGVDYVWQNGCWTEATSIWPCPQPRPRSRSRSPKRPKPPASDPPYHVLVRALQTLDRSCPKPPASDPPYHVLLKALLDRSCE